MSYSKSGEDVALRLARTAVGLSARANGRCSGSRRWLVSVSLPLRLSETYTNVANTCMNCEAR